ncbi:MAG TPA: TonB-dependent receptor, partial [Thermoanaerobaculales bacterium]|nr:TonB-dependent receptor [Thermoanaerobaculales bacterium]
VLEAAGIPADVGPAAPRVGGGPGDEDAVSRLMELHGLEPGGFVVLRSEHSRRWSWMVRGAAYDRDERPGPTEQVVPGHGVVDASVGYRLSPVLELQLLGRNLLDNTHLASADEATVLAAGRSIQLSVRGILSDG